MLNQTWYISEHSSLYHTIGDPESPGSSASRFSIFGKRYWIMSLNLVISETTCAMCNTWFGIRLVKIVPEVLSFYPQAMAPERVLPLRFSFFSSRNSSHNLQTKKCSQTKIYTWNGSQMNTYIWKSIKCKQTTNCKQIADCKQTADC